MSKKFSRREFLGFTGSSALAAAAAPSSSPFQFTTDDFELREIRIESSHLGANFNNYRVGFLTDMHLGFCVPLEWIERTTRMVQQAGVDLLLLGGDYIWVPDSALPKSFGELRETRYHGLKFDPLVDKIYNDLAQSLTTVKAPDGAFAVLGNHDRWVSPTTCISVLQQNGINILNNSTHSIRRGNDQITIIGVDDYWNGIPKMPTLRNPRSEVDFRVLLCHNPDFVSRRLAAPESVWKQSEFDLAICGHTHGGQIKLPLIGALSYNIQDSSLGEGLVQRERAQIYTSHGVGVVEVPYRVNCRPEVTVFELRRIG